jgi:HlyD family secretion protein
VRSPVNGRVLRVLQESETIVPSGAPLVELGDPTDLEVIVDVLTTEAVGIASGAPAAIERWGGPAPLQGRVRLVEPGAFTRVSALGVEEQRVWVVIDLVEPRESWAALGDGFRVDALITVEVMDDAVILPVSAMFRSSAGWAVFIVRDGVARERALDILRRGGRSARVGAGVAPGERVVLFPPSALRDGSRVRPLR